MIRRAMERPTERPTEPLNACALATLQSRWGNAVVRLGDGPSGSPGRPAARVATLRPSMVLSPWRSFRTPTRKLRRWRQPAGGRHLHGVPGAGRHPRPGMGLPAEASVVIRGGPSSGKTTLALRTSAEAQGSGDIVAWLDLGRSFDPGEALCRGVDLRWLLVIRPVGRRGGPGPGRRRCWPGAAWASSSWTCRPACGRALDEPLRRLVSPGSPRRCPSPRAGAGLAGPGLLPGGPGRRQRRAPGAGAARLAAPGPGRRRAAHQGGRGQEPLRATGSQRGPGHPLPHGERAGDAPPGLGWPRQGVDPGCASAARSPGGAGARRLGRGPGWWRSDGARGHVPSIEPCACSTWSGLTWRCDWRSVVTRIRRRRSSSVDGPGIQGRS